MLRMWNRLIKMENSRLTKVVFDADYNSNIVNSWCGQVKEIFGKINMPHLYLNKEPCNIDNCKEAVCNYFRREWALSLSNFAKLRSYRIYKNEYKVEKYLNLNLNRYERSLMAQFRVGILPLRIEVGRYRGEEVHFRKCVFCDSEDVEDEQHFLLKCSMYNEFRQDLLSKCNLSNMTPNLFRILMSEDKYAYHVVNFVKQSYNKRIVCIVCDYK